MVSPDSDRDDEDVDHNCEDTQQNGKNIWIQLIQRQRLNDAGEKS